MHRFFSKSNYFCFLVEKILLQTPKIKKKNKKFEIIKPKAKKKVLKLKKITNE